MNIIAKVERGKRNWLHYNYMEHVYKVTLFLLQVHEAAGNFTIECGRLSNLYTLVTAVTNIGSGSQINAQVHRYFATA